MTQVRYGSHFEGESMTSRDNLTETEEANRRKERNESKDEGRNDILEFFRFVGKETVRWVNPDRPLPQRGFCRSRDEVAVSRLPHDRK